MNRKLLGLAALLVLLATLSACAPIAVTGAAVGAVMVSDRRTTGMYVEDENIEWKVIGLVHEKYKSAHVNATSYNRKVLLTGEVPSEEAKKELATQVKAIASVVDVANEVQVAGNPVKLSHSAVREPGRWPTLGAHTREILAADLGLDDLELSRLRAQKVIS